MAPIELKLSQTTRLRRLSRDAIYKEDARQLVVPIPRRKEPAEFLVGVPPRARRAGGRGGRGDRFGAVIRRGTAGLLVALAGGLALTGCGTFEDSDAAAVVDGTRAVARGLRAVPPALRRQQRPDRRHRGHGDGHGQPARPDAAPLTELVLTHGDEAVPGRQRRDHHRRGAGRRRSAELEEGNPVLEAPKEVQDMLVDGQLAQTAAGRAGRARRRHDRGSATPSRRPAPARCAPGTSWSPRRPRPTPSPPSWPPAPTSRSWPPSAPPTRRPPTPAACWPARTAPTASPWRR